MTDEVEGDPAISCGTAVRRRSCQAVRWTATMNRTFFTHLAGSCNVTEAARTIGLLPSQVYYRRKTNAAFGKAWDEAIAIAYQVLETRIIGHVLAGGSGGGAVGMVDGLAPEPIAWDEAVKLLAMHKARRDGRVGPRLPSQAVATRAQTDAVIAGKLKVLAARNQRAAAIAAGVVPGRHVALPAPAAVSRSGARNGDTQDGGAA